MVDVNFSKFCFSNFPKANPQTVAPSDELKPCVPRLVEAASNCVEEARGLDVWNVGHD